MTDTTEAGFGRIDLSTEAATIAPGAYLATVSEARVIKNQAGDTIWLFITLETYTDDGELLGQVEDKFITIGSKLADNKARVIEGLKKLAIYAQTVGVDVNGVAPDEVPGLLVGGRLKATVSRRGTGIHTENRIVRISKA